MHINCQEEVKIGAIVKFKTNLNTTNLFFIDPNINKTLA